MLTLAWTVLFAPLAASIAITFFTRKNGALSGWIACGAMLASFALSVILMGGGLSGHLHRAEANLTLVALPGLDLQLGVLLDRLSCLMLLVVTGVGTGIFFYSTEYMHGDRGYARYFAALSLFAFSMLGIVLSTNFFQTFIFWELVGASSYLLIGHWYEKDEAADAGKKAFITTRVGDAGFLIGILMLWAMSANWGSATLSFAGLDPRVAANAAANGPLVTAAALLIFCGVIGKSAQFPLHVWLPDAMEGPTPVSALIHAATMVAAGIYLVARSYFLFAASPAALTVIAWLGGITALMAATLALVQDDIKKILAYSTLSQLGFMVMALGLGSSAAAMYHLTTHAFFKALLFLGAGSVIHALHTQDIREMGGLLRRMPVTGWTFLAGFLALAGVFPFSGFFSKDEILGLAASRSGLFYALGSVTAFFTAFYMGRLFFTVFLGEPAKPSHPHEPSRRMTVPLVALAVLSAVSGFFGLGHFLHNPHDAEVRWNFGVVAVSTALALAGILLSYLAYALRIPLLDPLKEALSPVRTLLVRKYFMDDLYDALVKTVQQNFARLCDVFERRVIVDGMVNGTARLTGWLGGRARLLQTGKVQFYALMVGLGVTVMTYCVIILKK